MFLMPSFEPKTYPAPVITKADNHPIYCNGTELINGMPFLSGNKTDESRIEELTKLGFSHDAIRLWTDSEFVHYYFRGAKGAPCSYGTSLPYKPSYSKIGNETVLSDPDNYLVKHKIEITPLMDVAFNGVIIAESPKSKAKGSKIVSRTQAEKLKFCKAVIYSIIPGEIKTGDYNKSALVTVIDDAELRRYIALYPAVLENQIDDVKEEMQAKIAITALPGIIAVPEVIAVSAPIVPVLTSPLQLDKESFDKCFKMASLNHEEMTGYPSAWELEKITPDVGIEQMDLKSDQIMIEKEFIEELYLMDSYNSIALENEFNNGEEVVLYDLIHPVISPVIIRQWNHGTMIITEEVKA